MEVGGGCGSEFLDGDAALLRNEFSGDACVRWFVALAFIGLGGEEWRIGFDQHAVERDDPDSFADERKARVGCVAREGHMEAEVERALCLRGVSAEAMHDATQVVGCPMLQVPLAS